MLQATPSGRWQCEYGACLTEAEVEGCQFKRTNKLLPILCYWFNKCQLLVTLLYSIDHDGSYPAEIRMLRSSGNYLTFAEAWSERLVFAAERVLASFMNSLKLTVSSPAIDGPLERLNWTWQVSSNRWNDRGCAYMLIRHNYSEKPLVNMSPPRNKTAIVRFVVRIVVIGGRFTTNPQNTTKTPERCQRKFIPCSYRTINSIFNQLVNQHIGPRSYRRRNCRW